MKIFVRLLVIFTLFFGFVFVGFAKDDANSNGTQASSSSSSSDKSIKVTVPENIPGANCVATGTTTNKMYECTIKPGMGTLKTMIAGIIKFFLAVTVLAGVLFLVINGMMLSMMGGEKEKIKGRIVKAIVGLVLVLMSGLILSILFPWIYT